MQRSREICLTTKRERKKKLVNRNKSRNEKDKRIRQGTLHSYYQHVSYVRKKEKKSTKIMKGEMKGRKKPQRGI